MRRLKVFIVRLGFRFPYELLWVRSARKVLGLMKLNLKQAATSVNAILKVLPDHFKIRDRLAWSLCLKKIM